MLSVARVLESASGALLYLAMAVLAAGITLKGAILLTHAGMQALTFDQAEQVSSRVDTGVAAQERAALPARGACCGARVGARSASRAPRAPVGRGRTSRGDPRTSWRGLGQAPAKTAASP